MIPTFIELNPTELCNLTCSFCPRSQDYPNQNLHMSLETIDVVVEHIKELDEANDANRRLVISNTGRGEPSLHKYFYELSDKLFDLSNSTSNVRTLINTNGYKFDKHLDIYKKYNKVQFNVYYNYSYDEYLNFKDTYKHMNNVAVKRRKEGEESEAVNYNSRSGAIVNDMTMVIAKDIVYGFCNKPFANIFIDWNGDYILCCNDWVVMEPLDNVHNTSILDFYHNNPKLQKYKTMLKQERRVIAPCNTCNHFARNLSPDEVG